MNVVFVASVEVDTCPGIPFCGKYSLTFQSPRTVYLDGSDDSAVRMFLGCDTVNVPQRRLEDEPEYA